MRDVKYLLIGGGLASFHAAKQIRKADPEGSILLVTDEPVPPYDRPPLTKEFLRGEKTVEDLLYEKAETLAEQSIDLALGARVEGLDAGTKTATVAGGEVVSFEKALLATGGRPVQLPLAGVNLAGVHYLRSIADTQGIASDAVSGRKVVMVGGGFIGLEAAASLTQRGLDVTVIEAMPHIWARFADDRLAGFIQDYCRARGVKFLTNETVAVLQGEDRVQAAVLGSGAVVDCDLVCIGVGIRPNVELAEMAGLECSNGIVVDEHMRTSHPDIYAAGDVINFPDATFAKRRRVEHWGHAEYSGQIAGRNMAGDGSEKYDLLSYVWSDIFDLRLEFAGDESDADTVLVRGNMADAKFMVLYLREGVMTAYFAVNTETREFSVARRLVRARKNVAGRETDIENPAFSLRELV